MTRMKRRRRLPIGVATAALLGALSIAVVDGRTSAAEPAIKACTAAQFEAEMTKLGLDVNGVTANNSATGIVASMITDYKCNSFTGGLVPSFRLFNQWTNPGQVVDNGLIETTIVSANLTVNDQPYMAVPPDFPPAPNGGTYAPHEPSTITMRPGMWANDGGGRIYDGDNLFRLNHNIDPAQQPVPA